MAITVGSVEVDIIPNTQGIYTKLKEALVPAATDAGKDAGEAAGKAFGPAMQGEIADVGLRIGEEIGQQIANRIKSAVQDALKEGITIGGQKAKVAGARQGDDTGGAFARSMKARLEAAFRSMPKINVGLNDTGVDADLARLRARLESLSGRRIGIDVDAVTALAQITDIEERLRRIGAAHPNVAVRADTATARAQLAAMREEINRLTADPAKVRLETDGSFGARLRAAVQAAEASLPNISIGADTTPAEIEIARLRGQLTALRDQRVGIDIDAATATAQITDIQARLARLAATDADVNVRVDAAAARAQLLQVQTMVTALDGQTVRIDVDTRGALMSVLILSVAIGGLAASPAVPIVAAGIGAIAASAVTAGVGVGALAAVAIPAFSGIRGALEAQKAAQDAATNSTSQGGQTAAQAAAKALQLAAAQQALAAAQRNAGRQIAEAQRGVADAARQAAQANEQAAQQVKAAQRAVADAVQQAAERQQQAAQRVQQAEQSLAQAQRSARQAQVDLTRARGDAVRQLEDMNLQLADAELAQRSAILQVQEAKLALDKVLVNSKATQLQREQARLAYDEALQRLKEQQVATKRLQSDTAAANKAGVEGSTAVRSAQERLAQSQQDVADKATALKEAQADAAKAQIASTRAIADAQGKLAEAQRNVARVQEQGAEAVSRAQERVVQAQQAAADSIASAQRQIQSAQLSTASSTNTVATAQAKYQAALAKLTPSTRATFDAFVKLKGAFKAWSESLQPAVMPIFTRALNGMTNSLPGLTPIVLAAAAGIKKLQDRVSAGFKSPWWKSFKKDLTGSTEPAIVGLGVAFGRVFKGIAGIIQAFLSRIDGINSRMGGITGRFADWATNLKGSPEFEKFLRYCTEMGPLLAQFLRDIADGFFEIFHALQPVIGPLYAVVGTLARALGSIAQTLPWLIQGLFLAMVATRLWTLAVLAFNLVMAANPLTLIILGIVALVAAIIYAYKNWTWFREGVQAAFNGIAEGFKRFWGLLQWVWAGIKSGIETAVGFFRWMYDVLVGHSIIPDLVNTIIGWFQLLLSIMRTVFQAMGAVVMWLWNNAVQPALQGIGAVITWLYTNVVLPVFDLVKAAFRSLGAAATWLWRNVISPAFNGIGAAIEWAWRNTVRPTFGALRAAIDAVADTFRWLLDKVVRPVWAAISATIDGQWRNGIRPAFDALRSAIDRVADSFGLSKNAIGSYWSEIRDLTREPINWVLRVVWNNGLVSVWDKVADWIPGVPTLGKLPLLAQGGPMPMSPGVFNRPTAIVGEGNPRHPEYVIPTDPKYRSRAVALYQAAGAQLFAGGGIFGDIWDGVKDAGGWVKDRVGDVSDFFSDPVGSVAKLLDPFLDKIKPLSTTSWGAMAAGLPRSAIKGLKDTVKDGLGGLFGGGGGVDIGGSGVTRWTSVVEQALRMLGQPLSYVGITLRRMNQESGGNPTIVNKWDSNWLAGYPSVGLMQVIGPTFDAYAGPMRNVGPFLYGTSVNPLANVVASMRYALAAYGSLPAAYNRAGGYDSGGYLQPGLNLAYNGTGRPEPVFTSQQASALMRMATDPAAGMGDLHVQVYVGDREISDIARAEVRRANGQLVSTLRAGRR